MPESFPPAHSALNLRLALAGFGVLAGIVLGLLALLAVGLVLALPLFAMAAVAAVNAVVVLVRKRQRARAHRGADHRHDSLFE